MQFQIINSKSQIPMREQILQQIKNNQPPQSSLPVIDVLVEDKNLVAEFKAKLELLHVAVFLVNDYAAIKAILQNEGTTTDRVVTTIEELADSVTLIDAIKEDAHNLENVELAIIPAHFGVAENGAVWVTETLIKYRVLPFIAQQLAVVLDKQNIVANMHQAYDRIASTDYDFGVFIAGPSKTADIEQSLVLGAHGPKGMIVFIKG